eukprot:1194252-Prorocentrum_minimum.AAC.6
MTRNCGHVTPAPAWPSHVKTSAYAESYDKTLCAPTRWATGRAHTLGARLFAPPRLLFTAFSTLVRSSLAIARSPIACSGNAGIYTVYPVVYYTEELRRPHKLVTSKTKKGQRSTSCADLAIFNYRHVIG